MFKDLIGIQAPRDIQVREESALETLLKIEDRVVQEYVEKVASSWQEKHDNIYLPLHASLSSALPSYTEQDLQDLLLAKVNNDYNDKETIVLGIYTGVLLHVLTERGEQEEKPTVFTFDLNENEFHYLFYFAKRAGEVTVRKVKGDYTCSFIGSYGGQVEKLVIAQNTGDYAANGAGSYGGTIGTLLITQNNGDHAAQWAGSDGGKIGTLLITRNTGNDAAKWAGSDKGRIDTLLIDRNKGNNAAFLAGIGGGTIGTLLINHNKGNDAAKLAGGNGGKIDTLAFYEAGRNAGEGVKANRIVTGEEALELYGRLMGKMKCLKTGCFPL